MIISSTTSSAVPTYHQRRSRRHPPLKALNTGASIVPTARRAAQQGLVWTGDRKKYFPFRPDFYSSQPVLLAGSWDDWAQNVPLPIDAQTGEAGIVLELDSAQGDLIYKYNVGGKWLTCRADAAAADAQGCINNTTSSRKLVRFSFPAAFAGGPRGGSAESQVHLLGSFTGWQVLIPMASGSDGAFHCDIALPPGHHTFRFLVNAHMASGKIMQVGAVQVAQYAVLSHLPLEVLPSGVQVNSLRVPPPATFRILYHTNFNEAYITYRYRGDLEPFRCVRMYHQPQCSGLMVVHLPGPASDAVLEFSIQGISGQSSANISSSWGSLSSYDDESSSSTGGKVGSTGQPSWVSARGGSSSGSSNGVSPERDPPGSRLYTAAGAGTWRLKDNKLWLDEASQLPALMLCTDLDGTLIEDGDDHDWVRHNDNLTFNAAEHFGQYLAPAGGIIVYNTGRSIGMVEGLLAKKAGVMPWPAAIITAVGTKVFLFDVATRRWSPDPAYSHLLDDGWNLQEVRSLARQLMKRYHGAASCTDDGSEHPHRVSLQIRSDVLDDFVHRWSSGLVEAGVQHQMVASIGGEWRYVDCISAHAGKGRAMAYLASRFDICLEDVVAAGDSGNDLLMLGPLKEGPHPAIVMSNSHPEVWEWLASLTPEERGWIYTPKAERAAGLVEGLKAIIADKLAAKAAKARAKAKRQQAQALALQSQSPSPASSGMKALRAGG